ncbi:MAG: F0F1 ATP synthase subunit A [Desulfuromonadaceae bacterium]|nr:F0F1 ATP synthase subunit A [Desulfuromonadaceae bacterium]
MVHPFLILEWLAEQANLHLGPHVLYAWLVMILLIGVGYFATRKITEIPSGLQNFMEAVVEMLENFMEENLGPKGRRYFPLIGTLALFILTCNLIALVPSAFPPTANPNTNAAMALTVFGATHFIGFREHGIGYLKHFTGPMPVLAPFLFVIELIGHVARPLSLTLRLFGNMYGHEIVLMIFLIILPILGPVPMMFLGLLVAFIQTFVFTLLSVIYIAGALEEAH